MLGDARESLGTIAERTAVDVTMAWTSTLRASAAHGRFPVKARLLLPMATWGGGLRGLLAPVTQG